MPQYNAPSGSLAARWLALDTKIQIFGGGFGNGKTTGGVVKALSFMRDYPGSIGLVARATEERLNDSVVEAFREWTPKSWVKSFTKRSLVLRNGSQAWFRYARQKGRRDTSTTSNLLSTTFDWALVDQIDDKEITYKDVMDLLGRLRGQRAKYIGPNSAMPSTGPRIMMLTLNPTRSWPYAKLIRPLHIYKKTGQMKSELCDPDTGLPMIGLVEGSTFENAANLATDYIQGLKAAYHGSYRERYLEGSWEYNDDLVYSTFDTGVHIVPHDDMLDYMKQVIKKNGGSLVVREGFDYGLNVPSCYLLAFEDDNKIVHVIDGFYLPELSDETIVKHINKARLALSHADFPQLVADPSIFNRQGKSRGVGTSIARRFYDLGLDCCKANNDIRAGVNVVMGYLELRPQLNPYTGDRSSPSVFFSDNLLSAEDPPQHFIAEEMFEYRRARDVYNEVTDSFVGRNDHAVDALRYLLAKTSPPSIIVRAHPVVRTALPPELFKWRTVNERVSRNR